MKTEICRYKASGFFCDIQDEKHSRIYNRFINKKEKANDKIFKVTKDQLWLYKVGDNHDQKFDINRMYGQVLFINIFRLIF